MVFSVHKHGSEPTVGQMFTREDSYVGLLMVEFIAAFLVLLANVVAIIVLYVGRKTLFQHNFYMVVVNMIICTSLKGFVEVAFILPYYFIQRIYDPNDIVKHISLLGEQYLRLCFNLSVFADFGALAFSVLIAVNRFIAFTIGTRHFTRSTTFAYCGIAWLFAAIFPFFYSLYDCHYEYVNNEVYLNTCSSSTKDTLRTVIFQLSIHISYILASSVFTLYIALIVIINLPRKPSLYGYKRVKIRNKMQMRILKQSLAVFTLYALTIFGTLLIPLIAMQSINAFLVPFIENLLNLTIAFVHPACFLLMSGDMRTILFSFWRKEKAQDMYWTMNSVARTSPRRNSLMP